MSSTPLPIFFVDAFTTNGNSPFTGNPAAVCFLEYDDDISDYMKQKMATETNLSDTAFVSLGWKREEANIIDVVEAIKEPLPTLAVVNRTLRWFTPLCEVPLCGHATVASTKALVTTLLLENPKLKEKEEIAIEFQSRFRGLLGASYKIGTGRITINFPINPCMPLFTVGENWVQDLIDAIVHPELTPQCIQDVQYAPTSKILLLRLGDHFNHDDLRSLNPNFQKMKSIVNSSKMFGVIVTVKGENGSFEDESPHFYTRFFSPWVGVNEEPVCGSAQTVSTPYWTKEYFPSGLMLYGQTLLAKQASARGGILYCSLVSKDRVTVSGQAKIIINGTINVLCFG